MAAVAARITDQIAEAAPQRVGSDRQYVFRPPGNRQRRTLAPHRRGDVLQQQRDIGFDGFFGSFAAREVEIAVNHALHLGDVRFELLHRRVAREQL